MHHAASFTEKPEQHLAQSFVESGRYLWNANYYSRIHHRLARRAGDCPITTCPSALTGPQNARVPERDDQIELTGGGRTTVHRCGQVVVRDTGPWTPAVHTLL